MPSVSSEVVSSKSNLVARLWLLAVHRERESKRGHGPEDKAVDSFHRVQLHFWRARVGAAM